ncbi:uncharacterized protein LOC144180576 [Haemaphysalis longicornis]
MSSTSKFGKKEDEKHGSSCYMNPAHFRTIKEPEGSGRLDALKFVQFKLPNSEQHQYLDVGCGPGNFTEDTLLAIASPCRRIVGVDRAAAMVDCAREHSSHPSISYERLDIELDDPQFLVDKYGQFDRAYSFMVMQCVRDLPRAYRNLFQLLKEGGECALVSVAGTVITDVMYLLSCMDQWKDFVPDPREVYAERYSYSGKVVEKDVLAAEKAAVAAAGLELVSCKVYDSLWTLPVVDAWIDYYVPIFKLDAKIPEHKRSAFRDELRSLLLERSTCTEKGCSMKRTMVVVHAQKPARD